MRRGGADKKAASSKRREKRLSVCYEEKRGAVEQVPFSLGWSIVNASVLQWQNAVARLSDSLGESGWLGKGESKKLWIEIRHLEIYMSFQSWVCGLKGWR